VFVNLRRLFSFTFQGLAWFTGAHVTNAWGGSDNSGSALDEVVVTATLRSAPALEVPASVTVLDTATL
jgi:outer membrane cobalamin receptor